MEEVVWVIVGVVSVLLAIGVMAQLVLVKSEDDKAFALRSSVDSLYNTCNRVCSMPQETFLRTRVQLPAGSLLEASGKSICGSIGDELFCRTCPCDLEERVILNLTGPAAARFFFSHDYNCFFLRGENALNVSCVG